MGHRIAVMSHGGCNRWPTPEDLYARPANTFVAHFLGIPGMNLLQGMLVESGGTAVDGRPGPARRGLPGGSVPLPDAVGDVVRGAGPEMVLGVRPEALRLDATGPIRASVVIVELLGAETHVICQPERRPWYRAASRQRAHPGRPWASTVSHRGRT